jgi:hypothetical protein
MMKRIVAALLVAIAVWQSPLVVRAESPRKLALLVGCTRYVNNSRIRALKGPQNDVTILSRLLVARYGFAGEHMRVLSGWPEKEAERPTAANIAAGFAWLLENAELGSPVVVHLSGHGAQAPIPRSQADARDARNPEPDGLDELFLPADVGTWTNQGVERAIRDDQIGQWLDALKAKGAHVWIIFDCCHSGTMSRGVRVDVASDVRSESQESDDSGEVAKSVDPEALGIPDEAEQTRAVASSDARQSPDPSRDAVGLDRAAPAAPVGDASRGTGKGSVVAFYAAQAFEEAPDLPRPATAPKRPEHYFGMLTYTLVQLLQQSSTPLHYRELGCMLAGRYRAERGSRAPTPLFEGALDQRVLETSVSTSASPILLTRQDTSMSLDVGELHGVSPGAILAVFPQATGGSNVPLGHVRVVAATAAAATVESTAYGDQPQTDFRQWPNLASCRIVERAVGSLALKLAVVEPRSRNLAPWKQQTQELLKKLPRETRDLFVLVDSRNSADFELRWEAATPSESWLRLYTGGADHALARAPASKRGSWDARPLASYSGEVLAMNESKFRDALESDIRKIFAWRNLWRVVGNIAASEGNQNRSGLKLEVARIANEQDESGGSLLTDTWLRAGQSLEIRVRNDSLDDYWVTLIFVAGDGSIDVWYTEAIRQGAAFAPLRSTVDESSTGPEGFVMIAQPLAQAPTRPRFDILSQTRLGDAEAIAVRATPNDPLAAFMSSLTSDVATRGTSTAGLGPWEARSWSWVTIPREQSSQADTPAKPAR